jgi:hypothetical protein
LDSHLIIQSSDIAASKRLDIYFEYLEGTCECGGNCHRAYINVLARKQ